MSQINAIKYNNILYPQTLLLPGKFRGNLIRDFPHKDVLFPGTDPGLSISLTKWGEDSKVWV